MNTLPQILREPIAQTVYHRQGLFYHLKLNNSSCKPPAISTERNSSLRKTRLQVNRYSIEKSELESRRTMNYSTISYDYKNDPEFYGTKGKKDQIESYQILVQERQKEAEVLGMRVAAFRGTKQIFEEAFNKIESQFNQELSSFQSSFRKQILNLRQSLSELRRQTQLQIKSFKHDIKQENQELIIYCEELKRIDFNYKKFKEDLENN